MKKRFWFLTIAFCISFITVVSLSFYYLKKFSSTVDFSEKVDHTNHVITELYKIQSALNECDINEYGYLLTRDKNYTDTVMRHYGSIYRSLLRLGELNKENPEQVRALIMLKSALMLRMDNFRKNIAAFDSLSTNTIPVYYFEGRKNRLECLERIDRMLVSENSLLKENFTNRVYFQHITSSTLKYILLTFCVITILLFILMLDELRKRVRSQQELQNRLIDLESSHSELQQIAFAASHNLQEPLRKIKIFGDKLLRIKKDDTDKETADIVTRMNTAATQAGELITELVSLTSLVNDNQHATDVDLNNMMSSLLKEMDDIIKNRNAVFHISALPTIQGYKSQLSILFLNLVDNALKFSRADVQPVISIDADTVAGAELSHISKQFADKKYHRITIADNGIGFDDKYADKIFLVFQRLQDAAYEGKGVGLAICKRIMANHSGFITATGKKKNGATFTLYFPVN